MRSIIPIEKKILDTIVKRVDLLFFIAVIVLSLVIRFVGRDFFSADMETFLIPWYEEFKANGGIRGLSSQVGDYNLLYQTFIAITTYIPVNPIYAIKSLSIVFDYILAFGVMSMVKTAYPNSNKFISIVAFAVTILLPNVFINSAVWGQCDSIYASFCIWAVLSLYKERYPSAFILLGLAFACKLQAIFILPIFLAAYFYKKNFSILYSLLSVFTFWSTGIICYIEGRPIMDIFFVYKNQISEYPNMFFGTHSFWIFISNDYASFGKLAICLTLTLCGIGLYVILRGIKKIDSFESFINTAAWFAWTMVIFLPAMHERYTYVLDILLLVLALIDTKYLKYTFTSILLTLITYGNFLYYRTVIGLSNLDRVQTVIFMVAWIAFSAYILKKDKIANQNKN